MRPSIKVSHLVVNGCSFTYCQGLENPAEQGWPALFAKKLKVPVVNLAIPGSGNDGIFRRSYEYFYLNQSHNNHPLFINVWSFSARREEFFIDYNNNRFSDFVPLDLQGKNPIEKEVVLNLSSETGMYFAERRKLLYWASVIQLYKNNKVPYLMSDTFPPKEIYLKRLKENFPNQVDLVYKDKCKTKDLNELVISYQYEKLPCGHYGPKANIAIAQYLYDTLTNMYDVYITKCDNYTDLESYYTNSPIHHEKNEWRTKQK